MKALKLLLAIGSIVAAMALIVGNIIMECICLLVGVITSK